jgi:hypothetical protein
MIGKPEHIREIFDNGGRSADRYTLLTSWLESPGVYMCLSLSDNCASPNGFSQWGAARIGPHLGRLIYWGGLPANVRTHVGWRMTDNL